MWGQNRVMSDCFSALPINLPLYNTGDSHLSNDAVVNYFSEDQFTFWYRVSVQQSGTLNYAVWPTNSTDVFQTMVYRYRDTTFCRHLVSGLLEPESMVQTTVAGELASQKIQAYSYELEVDSGETYFLSVMSLLPDFCGHRLDLNFEGKRIAINVLNKPCFEFSPYDDSEELELMPVLNVGIESSSVSFPQLVEKNYELPDTKIAETTDMEPASAENMLPSEEEEEPAKLVDAEIEEGAKLNLEEIFFYNNTYAFRRESSDQLTQLLELMNTYPELKIEIGGHTSGNTRSIKPDPNTAQNGEGWDFKGNSRKLSKMRAEAVKKYLVKNGIKAGRIKTKGYANDERIVENPMTPDDHQRNMRVEIAIISGNTKPD